MYSVDKSGFKELLLNFFKQISQSPALLKKADITIDKDKIQNILYLGMGGSAIAGDLLSDVLYDSLNVPLTVIRGYSAPAFCNENTLVIASSYSGNTEETLSALEDAQNSGAQILCITSGGKLAKSAQKNSWQIITIPSGLPPRQALGYLFFPLYHFMGQFDLVKEYKEDLSSLTKFAKDMAKRNNYPNTSGNVLSLELARTIQNKIPVFYSTTPYLRTVSRRWQNQVHENGKSMAFANLLPEMNHNEIVGWQQNIEAQKDFIVVFLENENPHPRIHKRIELSKQIIKDKGVEVVDIYSSGKSVCEKVFSLIILGDWVSYHLAIAYKKDPIEIKNIDYLKSEMAKEE